MTVNSKLIEVINRQVYNTLVLLKEVTPELNASDRAALRMIKKNL